LDYDVIVAGGGVSGLIAAKEVASAGLNVIVLEDDLEIGIPEKCSGLVSMKALTSLGLVPSPKVVRNEVKRAAIHSPTGAKAEFEAIKQKVVVLDRREFDRELARLAISYGAVIEVGEKIVNVKVEDKLVKVKTNKHVLSSKIFVEARGISSLIRNNRAWLLQAAQYDLYGSWFEEDKVELYFDNRVSPGFFTWVIPLNDDVARVGVAGKNINPLNHLERFISDKKSVIIKKISAPIYVGGALRRFINGNIVIVGDAAGQTKPTTGG